VIRGYTLLFTLFAWGSLAIVAAAERPLSFSLPDSIALFGNYNDLRVVSRGKEQVLGPPNNVGYNGGYFASPSLSPRGDAIAWGFVVEWQARRRQDRARFALGVYSLADQKWSTFGDFDDIGTTAYSSSASRIAFVARENARQQLLVFDVARKTWSAAPYPTGGLRQNAALSWSPDDKRLAVEVQRGGLPYSPQMSKADADRNAVIAVMDVEGGNLRMLGEGRNPMWSPDGQWIAYYEPGGARCLIVHPDGTGLKVVKTLRQSLFSYRSFVWGGPVWSPDSRHLLFTVSADDSYVDLMLLDLVTGRTTMKLRKGYPIYGWVRSPDGRGIHDRARDPFGSASFPLKP
jgi:Tol biopolymer transport system component